MAGGERGTGAGEPHHVVTEWPLGPPVSIYKKGECRVREAPVPLHAPLSPKFTRYGFVLFAAKLSGTEDG